MIILNLWHVKIAKNVVTWDFNYMKLIDDAGPVIGTKCLHPLTWEQRRTIIRKPPHCA